MPKHSIALVPLLDMAHYSNFFFSTYYYLHPIMYFTHILYYAAGCELPKVSS